ncbi:hypothetical protein [Paenibacillus senegalimassiliensis]|uniref:hypothetical protein n=1 Tax=Paenibacillus senegalimassiliensis TaxID=1737426 RepID=UPI00073E88D5|nr:hypothetical protein [Paenibacillus senegalimassiliensis]
MDLSIMEKVVVQGDLSSLKPEERLIYYTKVCESVGLNPLTKPFDYLKLDGKLVLYAKRDATDQLRKIHKISITITSRERIGDVYCVTARGETTDHRTDESIGAVSLMKEEKIWDEMRGRKVSTGKVLPLTADELANAVMKAETKAKRRVTLSLSGLGMMDESEIETIEDAERIEVGEPAQSSNQIQKKPTSDNNESKAESKTTNNKGKNNSDTKPSNSIQKSEGEIYKMLDMATGTSPGGVTFAKMKVVNLATGEESIMLANTEETINQVNAISNNSQFKIDFEMSNGFKIVKSVQLVGEAA